jgi:hypothetical protein
MTVLYGDVNINPGKAAIGGARFDYRTYVATLAATLATTNIFVLGILPANHRLLDLFLEVGPGDTGTALTWNVGLLNWYLNRPEPAAATPGWDMYNGTPGIPAQVGSASGAALPAEADGLGATSAAIATGFLAISASTIGRSSAGGRAGVSASVTPMITYGSSKFDRLIGVQLGVAPTTGIAACKFSIGYLIDQP